MPSPGPRVAALAGIFAISFSAIFVRAAGVSPGTSVFFRLAYALPVLVVLWLLVRKEDARPVRARWFAFAAGVSLAVDLSFWHRSIEYVGAGLATVLGNTQVLLVGILAWVLHRERPARANLVAVPVALVGLALVTGLGREDAYGADPVKGVILGALTALAYTGYILLLRNGTRSGGSSVGPLLEASLGGAIAGLLLGAVFDPGFSVGWSWPGHGWLLALALVAHTGGWLIITRSLPRLPAIETSILLLLQPCLTLVWGVLFFREDPSWVQWSGVAVVLAAVAGASLAGARRASAPPARAEAVVGPAPARGPGGEGNP